MFSTTVPPYKEEKPRLVGQSQQRFARAVLTTRAILSSARALERCIGGLCKVDPKRSSLPEFDEGYYMPASSGFLCKAVDANCPCRVSYGSTKVLLCTHVHVPLLREVLAYRSNRYII